MLLLLLELLLWLSFRLPLSSLRLLLRPLSLLWVSLSVVRWLCARAV